MDRFKNGSIFKWIDLTTDGFDNRFIQERVDFSTGGFKIPVSLSGLLTGKMPASDPALTGTYPILSVSIAILGEGRKGEEGR
jgi:hypothetical protein